MLEIPESVTIGKQADKILLGKTIIYLGVGILLFYMSEEINWLKNIASKKNK